MDKKLNTLFIGQKHLKLKSVDSTNNYTINLIRQNDIVEGTVVSANYQTVGKGQRDKFWYSEPGKNLLMSIALRPAFLDISDQFYLSKVAAIALVKTLNSFGIGKVKIKWPNDILIEGHKIAGVLIENVIKPQAMDWAIIGIGLNVNQMFFPKFNYEAISMKTATGRNFEIEEVFEKFMYHFEGYYLLLKNKALDTIDKLYHSNLYALGQKAQFYTYNNQMRTLTINRVRRNGMLECINETQALEAFDFSQIRVAGL